MFPHTQILIALTQSTPYNANRMSLTLVPKTGMVLVRPIPPATPKAGNIELADYYDEPETTGEVVALAERFTCPECGAGRESDVAVGDVVLFPASAGQELEWQGVRYLLIPEIAIAAVVEECEKKQEISA